MNNQKIEIQNSQGGKIAGILDLPDGNGPFPIAIILHGFGGNKENTIIWTEILNPLGIATLRIDFNGTGESDGEYENKTLSGFLDDAQSGLNYVCSESNIDKDKIAIVGHSMGGTAAILLAAKDSRISTMIATSPAIKPGPTLSSLFDPQDFSTAPQKGYAELRKSGERKRLKYAFFEDAAKYDVTKEAQKIPYKFLVVAAEKDDLVFFEDIMEFKTVVKNAELFQVPSSGHNLEEDWNIIAKKSEEWLATWLQS